MPPHHVAFNIAHEGLTQEPPLLVGGSAGTCLEWSASCDRWGDLLPWHAAQVRMILLKPHHRKGLQDRIGKAGCRN